MSSNNTVFVRGLPSDVVRYELEEIYSSVAPAKKCSVIRGTTKDGAANGLGFGFVKVR